MTAPVSQPSVSVRGVPHLLISRRGWSPTGGAERFLQRFAAGLKSAGVRTTLLADARWPEEQWTGDELVRLAADSPETFAQEVARAKERFPGAALFSMERLPAADFFRAGDGLHAAWLDRLASEGFALADWFRRRRTLHRELLDLERRLFAQPRLRVVANSRMVAEELGRYYGFPAERIAVIPNGYDPRPMDAGARAERRRSMRTRLGIADDAVVFLFVGSGWKRKGAQVLVDAFKRLAASGAPGASQARLVLVGKGRVSGGRDPRIVLAGPVADPTDHYLAADVFVLPTLYDPFSNACLEASAFGLPVLTTDANGFAEVLASHAGAGEVVGGPREVERWAKALAGWLSAERRAEAHAATPAITAHYSVARNVEATVEFIRASLANP